VVKPPKGYHANVMLKVNTKLGGTNHTLASRLPRQDMERELQKHWSADRDKRVHEVLKLCADSLDT